MKLVIKIINLINQTQTFMLKHLYLHKRLIQDYLLTYHLRGSLSAIFPRLMFCWAD
jgi:hypothetical protein